jgi:hypothetical protein
MICDLRKNLIYGIEDLGVREAHHRERQCLQRALAIDVPLTLVRIEMHRSVQFHDEASVIAEEVQDEGTERVLLAKLSSE